MANMSYRIPKTKDEVLELVDRYDIEFIRLWFTDILGRIKSFAITRGILEDVLENGIGFDGSSITGFQDKEESDMIAKPDISTFRILPWRPKDKGVARMIVDIHTPDGKPYEGDPRYVLKRMVKKAAEMGFTAYFGPELEYFYFKTDKLPEILDEGGYFDLTTLDVASDLRRDTILTLEEMGIDVEYSHHEVGPSQHEIDLKYDEAVAMADKVITYKITVKEIATRHGVYATFMPKPIFGVSGSGMHTHQSLFRGNKNAFFDANSQDYLSDIAKHYIAGLLNFARESILIWAPTVNSYKRLVPGYEAPVYISWSRKNRSALIRVPWYQPGKEKATRIELRCPDPSGNPYLQFAVMLGAGLKGIEMGLTPPDPIERNLYELEEPERLAMGVESLPGSLGEALVYAEKSEFLKEVLGEHIFARYIYIKKQEWNEYRSQVTQWEIKKYLPVL